MAKQNTIGAPKHVDDWAQGFGLALAEVNRRFSQPTLIAEVASAAGFHTMAEFKASGLDAYDLKELRKCLPKAPPKRARRRRRHSGFSQVRCDICSPMRCVKAK